MNAKYHDYLYTPSYNHPSPVGVYAMMSVRSGKLYVGSTTNFSNRNAQHFKLLEEGIHFNRNLQYDFNLYGPATFSFVVLESGISPDLLEKREQVWIQRLGKHTKLFNIQQVAQRPEWEVIQPVDRIDFPWSDDTPELPTKNVPGDIPKPNLGEAQ